MSPRRIDRQQSNRYRRRQRRPERVRILIVCEGFETERNYFDQMKRQDFARDHLAVTVKRGKGGSRTQVARHAVRCKNETGQQPFDEIWCVMDAEKPSDREDCEAALRILGKHEIKPCLPIPRSKFGCCRTSKRQRTPISTATRSSATWTHNGKPDSPAPMIKRIRQFSD